MSPEPLSLDIAWVLIASFLVAVMQAGFTCLESGFVRSKNSINVAIKNLVDFCISSLLFALVGYQLMFGESWGGIIGLPHPSTYEQLSPQEVSFFIFQLMFCGTAATIISGAVAERLRFIGYIIITLVSAGVIYPIVGHWIWNTNALGEMTGWLGQLGFVDFAGSTVVHAVGGWISLAAVMILGPRIGRFGPGGHTIHGQNLPMAVLGVFLLWFGFFGFNGGSTLAFNTLVPLIVANTALSGAAGGMVGLLVSWKLRGHPSVDAIINGTISGLVAICASANVVGEGASVVIGLVAGGLAIATIHALEKIGIDDVIGAVPSHLVAGIWGTLAVALFADLNALGVSSRLDLLGVQLLGTFAVGLFAFPLSFVIFFAINRFVPLRVSSEDERIGLNIAEHAATTSLLDLVTQMDWQARTGDFSKEIEVENETEAHQIATFYNAVLEKFQLETGRRQEALERLTELATTDGLTGLPNRRVYFDLLRRAIASSSRNHRQGAVMYMDLDGFKKVNDTLGHDAGDELLKQVALRLTEAVRESDMVARLGGDEFALLVSEVETLDGIEHMAEKLIDALSEPFDLKHGTANIGVSVGIAVFGGSKSEREDVETVIKRSDNAMYDAKLSGKGTWRMSEPEWVKNQSDQSPALDGDPVLQGA
ncbi:ammonium transporter [Magnetovibrio sp. PR-2]|uniref:ammonium transporter n=1 Tax=Magnetovibrio sp. PR-2 TaxID=3120356 RepID=UPI002FCE3FDF